MHSNEPWYALCVALGLALTGCSKEAKMEWTCEGTTKNSMQCAIKNTGEAVAEACFDIVQICRNGEHVASVCSGAIQRGGMENKVVTAFLPPIGFLETCMGTEFRNKRIKAK